MDITTCFRANILYDTILKISVYVRGGLRPSGALLDENIFA